MILRRVIQHFRKQEWTAIALDFLIVVLGVFVGLQVQEWSGERAQAKQHARYYERLQSDFSAINRRIDGHFLVFDQSIESMEYVLELIRLPDNAFANTKVDQAQLESALANLGATRIPPGQSATYVEMLAAGQLSSIRNDTLRDRLAEYHRLSDIHLEVNRSAAQLMNVQTPITYRHIRMDTVPDEREVSGIRKVVLSYDLEGMRTDPEFEIALEILELGTRNNLGVRKVERKLTDEILQLLQSEIAK